MCIQYWNAYMSKMICWMVRGWWRQYPDGVTGHTFVAMIAVWVAMNTWMMNWTRWNTGEGETVRDLVSWMTLLEAMMIPVRP